MEVKKRGEINKEIKRQIRKQDGVINSDFFSF